MSTFLSIPDKEKNYEGYMLFALSNIWTVTIGLIVSMGFVFFPEVWERWLILVTTSILLSLLINYLIRIGKINLGKNLFLIFLWLFITIPCYSAGGIKAPGIISQVSVILTAGFLWGWRGGFALALLTMVTDFGFVYLEVVGKLPEPMVKHTPITFWIAAIIPFGTISALQYYATNQLQVSLMAKTMEVEKRVAAEKEKDRTLFEYNERVKELRALFEVSQLLQKYDFSPDQAYQKVVEILPLAYQFPEICAAHLKIDQKDFYSVNYRPSPYSQKSERVTSKGSSISIEILYLEKRPEMANGPFLKEESELINALVEMLKTNLERREHLKELNDYKYAIDKASLISITDSSDRFKYVNENFCKSSKFSREELLGAHWSIISSGIQSQENVQNIESLLKEGKYFRGEFCNKAKDGSLYWLDTTIVPFLDDLGEIQQILTINQDISERKEAEEKIRKSEQLLRKITSHVPGNTYMFSIKEDGSLDFHFMNRGFEPFNHTLSVEEVSKNSSLLLNKIHEDDRKTFVESLARAKDTLSEVTIQYRIIVNGQIRWRWFQAYPDKDKTLGPVWYGASSDITPLVEHIVSIEQFLFDLSHVLRRPTANLIGLVQVLNTKDLSQEEMKKVTDALSQVSYEMDAFVRDLNSSYMAKKKSSVLKIDFDSLVDKRREYFN